VQNKPGLCRITRICFFFSYGLESSLFVLTYQFIIKARSEVKNKKNINNTPNVRAVGTRIYTGKNGSLFDNNLV